jgi:kynureninase
MTSTDSFNRRRDEFPTLASGIHLLSHSLGPVPRAARDSMSAYCDAWEHHTSEDAWATSWWELSQLAGDRISLLLGGLPGSVQIQPSTSIALSCVVSCFYFGNSRRNKIVTSALDFPSMEYIWDAQRRLGAKVEIVPSPDGIALESEQLLAKIDETTCLVAISHVSFRSSFRVGVKEIVARAHSVGALVLLDVYQSAGTVTLEASGWDVDFMIGGTIKWLCGGPACGYLYVKPELQNYLRPRLTGWVAHEAPFDFAPAPMRYVESMRRFAQGTPSIPALYSAMPGLQIIEEVGVATIEKESRRRTEWMIEFALAHGWPVNSPRDVDRRGGSVMIGVEDGPAMVKKLAAQNIFVDSRPGVGLRISPHFFNNDDEVHEALSVLQELID